jgi:p-aminobenzoyl-glutamate transporter AbgT
MSAKLSHWEKAIPWFLTIASSLVLCSIAWFLIENIIWFRSNVFIGPQTDATYRMHIFHLHISMIKRSIALFSGFAMLFVGSGVSFYSVKTSTDIDFTSQPLSLKLATFSPGIIAMILGTALLMFTIASKDEFPSFKDTPTINLPVADK